MFAKLVSGLPFSPALVGQLGFYARRLKKEETTRRLGLIFTALALVVQSFAVFSPPEPANAASAADLIYGGVTSKTALLARYDDTSKDFKAIMDYLGISRAEIAASREVNFNSLDYGKDTGTWLSFGRIPRLSLAGGEVSHAIPGTSTTLYSRPLWTFDTTTWTTAHGSTYPGFVGTSAKIGAFAISKNCGNVTVRTLPTPPPPPPPVVPKDIQVCRPGIGVITIKDIEKKSTDLPADNEVCRPKQIQVCRPGVGVITIIENEKKSTDLAPTSPECQPKPKQIQVCRPGVGIVTISETEKKSTDLAPTSPECQPKPQPVAACSALESRMIERTKYNFTSTAVAQNGATINKHTFIVRSKDAMGSIITQKTITTANQTADSGIIEIKEAGTYHVSVIISSSIGDKTSINCAKIITVAAPDKCVVNLNILATDKECQPCPANPSLWYKDENCRERVASEKQATNLTQNGVLAANVTANGGDRIQFTVTMYNVGKIPASVDFKENMTDVLEYAKVYDNGGGDLITVNGAKYLNWNKMTLAAGQKVSRTFSVKVLDQIPLTPRGTSDRGSYDCIMTNTFGNTININMNCQAPKLVEQVVEQLPSTGPRENIIFSGIVTSIVVYFYARSRQLGKEIRLIRKDFNAGTL